MELSEESVSSMSSVLEQEDDTDSDDDEQDDKDADPDYIPETIPPQQEEPMEVPPAQEKRVTSTKERNLSLAYSVRRKPYVPAKKEDRIKVMRDLLLTHDWQGAAKWLTTLLDDIAVPHDMLYRQTMLVLEANKPSDVSFDTYYSRTVSPLVKSFLTMDINKREVLLDVCTLLCRHSLWNDAKQFLEENNQIIRNADSQGRTRYRPNETIDSYLVCYKHYLGYVEWLSELDEELASEHIEQLREARAQNLMTLFRNSINFCDSSNVDVFVFALHSMYDYYNLTQESLDLWDKFLEKCPDNMFAIIGSWNFLSNLLGSFEEKLLSLLKKLAKLDPSHPMILTMMQSGRLGDVSNETRINFATLLMDFVDYASNEPRKQLAWKLLVNLIEQMDMVSLRKVNSIYSFKYQSYWEYTHLKDPRGEEQEAFVQLVVRSVGESEPIDPVVE